MAQCCWIQIILNEVEVRGEGLGQEHPLGTRTWHPHLNWALHPAAGLTRGWCETEVSQYETVRRNLTFQVPVPTLGIARARALPHLAVYQPAELSQNRGKIKVKTVVDEKSLQTSERPGSLLLKSLFFAHNALCSLQTGGHHQGMSSRTANDCEVFLAHVHMLHHEHPKTTPLCASPAPYFLANKKTLF